MKKIIIIAVCIALISIIVIIFRKNIQKLFLSRDQIIAHCGRYTNSKSCKEDSWCMVLQAECPPRVENCSSFVCYAK